MKSNKQRRTEIMARRHARAAAKQAATARRSSARQLSEMTFVEPWMVALNNSFAVPRRQYSDYAFTCRDCAKPQVWTAARQHWWYEVAGGHVWSRAVRCAPCREAERLRVKVARQIAEAGLARKRERLAVVVASEERANEA
ncbi:zinc-ribbon domain-containing protein [Ideonella azotifigens]|nr:zinc-ribbon domain containing protein [Ideonella azotifigens]MCD2340551.1 zinc-ribbon domain-containing protein [Ideonella azotifigens]